MREELAKLLSDRLGIHDLAPVPNRFAPEGYKCVCKGADAVERWQQLRALADESGYWPVILGDDKEVGHILGVADSEHGEPIHQVLERVASNTSDAWLEKRRQSEEYDEEVMAELHGEWPEQADALTRFTIPLERGRQASPKPKVTIGLFPVQHCWEVPAYLNFGGWNACPDSDGHVLMMKRWFDRYGAEVAGMNGDVIEMYAHRPPTTRDDALALGEEQFLYCEDIVTQGTETIEALAAALLNNPIWFFWWD